MLSDDVLSATVPPSPSNMDEAARWEHTRLRRRLLSGHWEEDVRRRVRLRVGDTRASAWGIDKPGGVDLSGNLFSQVSGDLSTLYNRPPIWSSSLDPNGARTVAETLQSAGWVSMMQRVERDTLGCREYLLKVEPRIGGGVVLRPVVPDFVEALADPIERDMPIRIDEWQLRDIGGRIAWTRTRTDARDGTVRVYSATGDDISDEIGETWRDEWYDSSGSPVLPYILYHAQRTGYLWDPWEGIGLVEGTLTNSVNLTHLQHAITQAANPQRYMAGLEPIGEALEDVSGRAPRRVVMSDPAVILQFDRIHGFDGQPMVGQFEPGADIGILTESVERYERRVTASASLAGDLMRVSGDPRSGYAVAISREGQREASEQYREEFARSDSMLARLVACILNRQGESIPETGYSVDYQRLPLSQGERLQLLGELEKALEMGLVTRAQAYARYNGITEAEASEALEEDRE